MAWVTVSFRFAHPIAYRLSLALLDSNMAQIIVNTLSRLARNGKIIISTIHQPSSQVYQKFDM